jgi:uncharacterized cupin superfamily protein
MSTTVLMRNAPAHLIESFAPKPTTLTPGQREGVRPFWSAPGATPGPIDTGIWEAEPGSFTATRDGYHELCYLLTGSVTLVEDGEQPIEVGAGDLFVTPAGWRGTWHVHETVRKLYVIIPVA